MNTQSMHKRLPRALLLLLPFLAFAFLSSGSLLAQVPVDQVPVDDAGNPIEALDETVDQTIQQSTDTTPVATEDAPALTPEELESLIGPIALYPDTLLAIVLPASTYPLEIVQAARFLEQLEDDSSLEPDESWDDSVTALLNYPEVIKMMDKDIDWTWRLGEAVVRQQPDVIAAVEAFRDRAYAAGNLKTDDRQTVSNNGGAIEIQPVSEDIIYVPYYEPERVVYYQPRQVYYYYPRPYPVYYYPYPLHHSFASGYFWGVTTAFSIGWATDHLHVFHHSYWGHPYYGRHYFGHYYRRPSINVYNTYYANNHHHRSQHHHRDGDFWRPRDGGARPGHYQARLERFGDHPRERTVEGYRLPDRGGSRAASDNDRTGFRGEVGNTVQSDNRANTNREGFAASRNNADARNRARTNPPDPARQPDRVVSDNDTIRFRARDAADDAQQNRRRNSADTAVRVPERSATTRLAERRDSNDTIRFRSRNRSSDDSAANRARTSVSSSSTARDASRATVTENSRSSDRTAVRERSTRTTVTPRAVRTAPSGSGFRSSPGRSEAVVRPNVSRPQISQRAAPASASTPRAASRPSASAPTRTRNATPAPPSESRTAPRSRSDDATTTRRTSREQH